MGFSKSMSFVFLGVIVSSLFSPTLGTAGANPENGKKIFEERCLKCHGETGEGNGPGAEFLATKPASFANPKIFTDKEGVNLSPDARIAKVIKQGGESIGKSNLMQGFPDLTNQQIADVIAYIKMFPAKAKK